jgi:hypothetical protein
VLKTALITGAATVLAASAHAEVFTAEYTATLSNATSWPAGVALSGTYTFDSETRVRVDAFVDGRALARVLGALKRCP